MIGKIWSRSLISALFCTLVACYSPEQYEAAAAENKTASSDFGTLYEVNGGKQICNPSVTMDDERFPASMLWLNFSGTLNVSEVPDGYTTTKVGEHDRLTISDTAGRVLWFLMKDSVPGAACEFQDPEWTTSGEYIVALAGADAEGSKGCDEVEYGIFAARLSDGETFFLVGGGLDEMANPHLYVGAPADSIGSGDSLAGFFGTSDVKLVYVNPKGKLVYVDYAKSAKPVELISPEGAKGSLIDGPMISPDGGFVAYDILESSQAWKSYVQELSPDAAPFEIEKQGGMLSNPVFPHWWKFGDRLFLVWAEFADGNAYLNKSDLTNSGVWDSSIGRTAMREVSLSASAPGDVAVEWTGDVREVAPVPLIGGRSPGGHFVSTGTNNGYLLYIP